MGGQALEIATAAEGPIARMAGKAVVGGMLASPLVALGIDKFVKAQPGYGAPQRPGLAPQPPSGQTEVGAAFRAPSTSQASEGGLPSWVPLLGNQAPAGLSLDDQRRMLAAAQQSAYNEGLSDAQAQTAAERRRAQIAADEAQQAAEDEYIRQLSYQQPRRAPEAPPPVLG